MHFTMRMLLIRFWTDKRMRMGTALMLSGLLSILIVMLASSGDGSVALDPAGSANQAGSASLSSASSIRYPAGATASRNPSKSVASDKVGGRAADDDDDNTNEDEDDDGGDGAGKGTRSKLQPQAQQSLRRPMSGAALRAAAEAKRSPTPSRSPTCTPLPSPTSTATVSASASPPLPIPPVVHMAWHSSVLPSGMTAAVAALKASNPDLDFRMYDAAHQRAFLRRHFPAEVVAAYDALKPQAYKSDLFRYALLWKVGGIWIDPKLTTPAAAYPGDAAEMAAALPGFSLAQLRSQGHLGFDRTWTEPDDADDAGSGASQAAGVASAGAPRHDSGPAPLIEPQQEPEGMGPTREQVGADHHDLEADAIVAASGAIAEPEADTNNRVSPEAESQEESPDQDVADSSSGSSSSAGGSSSSSTGSSSSESSGSAGSSAARNSGGGSSSSRNQLSSGRGSASASAGSLAARILQHDAANRDADANAASPGPGHAGPGPQLQQEQQPAVAQPRSLRRHSGRLAINDGRVDILMGFMVLPPGCPLMHAAVIAIVQHVKDRFMGRPGSGFLDITGPALLMALHRARPELVQPNTVFDLDSVLRGRDSSLAIRWRGGVILRPYQDYRAEQKQKDAGPSYVAAWFEGADAVYASAEFRTNDAAGSALGSASAGAHPPEHPRAFYGGFDQHMLHIAAATALQAARAQTADDTGSTHHALTGGWIQRLPMPLPAAHDPEGAPAPRKQDTSARFAGILQLAEEALDRPLRGHDSASISGSQPPVPYWELPHVAAGFYTGEAASARSGGSGGGGSPSRNLFLTWPTKALPPAETAAVAALRSKYGSGIVGAAAIAAGAAGALNTGSSGGINVIVLDDAGARELIADFYRREPEVLWALDALLPGAFRADLISFAVLHALGGIYMDMSKEEASEGAIGAILTAGRSSFAVDTTMPPGPVDVCHGIYPGESTWRSKGKVLDRECQMLLPA